MFSRTFVSQALERAFKTFAQALIGMWAADGVLGVLDVDWTKALSVGAFAAMLSLLTSLASAPVGPEKGSPSLTDTSA